VGLNWIQLVQPRLELVEDVALAHELVLLLALQLGLLALGVPVQVEYLKAKFESSFFTSKYQGLETQALPSSYG
jgi:hypothetical protein